MPPDLDIDRTAPLLNTMAAYSEHVVLCTGKEDWHSNIEHEDGATGAFVRGLKSVIGKGGEAFDPYHNVLMTASSLPASQTPNTTSVLLFPAFKHIGPIPHTTQSWSDLATAYLKPTHLHPAHNGLSPERKATLLRDPSAAARLPPAEPIRKPTVLICGHGGRDPRCGLLGPLLASEFATQLHRKAVDAQVAQISHVGGHKYAGNVIVYLPPRPSLDDEGHALHGTGIWYGRVGPEHVEGVIQETIVQGRLILELLRGGITTQGGNVGSMIEAQIMAARHHDGESPVLKWKKPRARR
ncbi:hypothetical protein ACEQ8H_005051 [Pleosporales sp. CAS-2024a]